MCILWQAPVFLLFLDCVWQLLQQFPSRLALTETFLTSLWDTQQLGLTDTFLFDSAWHRHRFSREGRRLAVVCLPCAWEWHLQFSQEDVLLFNNPLFSLRSTCDLEHVIASARGSLRRSVKNSASSDTSSAADSSYARTLTEHHSASLGRKKDLFREPPSQVLSPVSTTAARLQLWSQCYLRWCVPAQILEGGRPAAYLQQCLLVEEVVCLDHKLRVLEEERRRAVEREGGGAGGGGGGGEQRKGERLPRPHSGLVFSLESHSPLNSVQVTSSFPFAAAVTAKTQHKLISGPLSLYLLDSLVQYDYASSED